MERNKTEERLICLQHTELSVGRPGHSPSSLSGAPAVQVPESFKHSVITFTNSAQCCYRANARSVCLRKKHRCKSTCGSSSQCFGMEGRLSFLNMYMMRLSSVTLPSNSDSYGSRCCGTMLPADGDICMNFNILIVILQIKVYPSSAQRYG